MQIYCFEITIVAVIVESLLLSFTQAFTISLRSSNASSLVVSHSIPLAAIAVLSTVFATHFHLLQFKPIVAMATAIITVYVLFLLILIVVADFVIVVVILLIFVVTLANVHAVFGVPIISAVLIVTVIVVIFV